MVSVCLATYNGEKYIRQQVESILPQLSAADEIVVSDDESTDQTVSILESFNDSRIHIYIHKRRNEKVVWDYATHNFENALSHAKGDYIFLSDQDDVFLPEKISKMKQGIKSHLDLAICNCKICDSALNEIDKTQFEIDVTKSYLEAFTKFRMLGCCMAFHRALYEKARPFPPSKVGHDLWLFLVAKHYGNVIYIDEPLHLYRRHDSSVTTAGAKSHYPLSFRLYYRLYIVKAFLGKILFRRDD